MELTFQKPFDAHLHLRQGAVLSGYAQRAAAFFESALVMPNTKPPILTADDLKRYRAAITTAVPNWRPLMSFQIHPHADIPALKAAGAVAGKYYPAGLTNADSSSCQTLADFDSVLAQMEEFGIVLSVHCEAPLYSEEVRHRVLDESLEVSVRFPNLKIVLEHISLEREVEAVRLAGEKIRICFANRFSKTKNTAAHCGRPLFREIRGFFSAVTVRRICRNLKPARLFLPEFIPCL